MKKTNKSIFLEGVLFFRPLSVQSATSPLKSVIINQNVFISVRVYFTPNSEQRFLIQISKWPIDGPKLKVAHRSIFV